MALFGITTQKPAEGPLVAFAKKLRTLAPKIIKPDTTRAERLYGAKGKQS
jgi:hypothetical protein